MKIEKKDKPKVCRRKINGTKKVVSGTCTYKDTFDPRYQVCSNCGNPRKKP